MSRKQQPEIPEKLLDALIRTVVEQGFSPSIDAIVHRAGVCKMSAYSKFKSRERMTVMAIERVSSVLVKNLNAALAGPPIHKICTDTGLPEMANCLTRQLTDQDNPIGFITACLLGHPDPRSEINIAASKAHADVVSWLENFFTAEGMPNPQMMASSVMAMMHGTCASILANQPHASRSILGAKNVMVAIFDAAVIELKRRDRRERTAAKARRKAG